jgi:hypothetical protein
VKNVLQAAEVAINKMLNNDVYKRNLHLQELEMALELAKARVFELQQSAVDANVDLRKYGLAPEQLQVSVAYYYHARSATLHQHIIPVVIVLKVVHKCSTKA